MVTTQRDASEVSQVNPIFGSRRFDLTRTFCLLIAIVPGLIVGPAWSAKWDVVPTLSAAETYTDNVALAPNSSAVSDWVTQVTPGISIRGTGSGLNLYVRYAPQILYYSRDLYDQNDVYQIGNATLKAELAENLLFVDAGANVDQYNISLQGPITDNNVNVTGNRATVATFFVSPYLLHDFGSEVRGEARYTYTKSNSNDPTNNQDAFGNAIILRLGSGPAHKSTTWDLSYDREKTEYEGPLQPDLDTEKILAKVRRLVTPTIGLLGRVGYEYYKYGDFRPESNGVGWGVGVDWAPSSRINMTAIAGRRFYGNSYEFDFRYRARLFVITAGYNQDVTTTRQEFFVPATSSTVGYLDNLYANKISDPAIRQQTVESLMNELGIPSSLGAPVNYYTDQLFLDKRWNASITAQGVKNVVIGNFFLLDRNALFGDVLLPGAINEDNHTKQTGTSVVWNLRITPRDTWNLFAGYMQIDYPGSNRKDDLLNVQMGFKRQLQRRVFGTITYRRQERSSNQTYDYTENAGIATLQVVF